MNDLMEDPSSDSTLLKRRSSVFKPTLEDDAFFKKALAKFMASFADRDVVIGNAPIVWDRLATGFRIIDFQMERTGEALDILKTNYFCLNNSCGATALYIDSYTLRKYQKFVFEVLSDFNSFCAIEEGTGKMVGVALARVELASSEAYTVDKALSSRDVFNVIELEKSLLGSANIYERFKVEKYFCIHVVCVEPDFYGNGIATSLTRACLSRAQKINYPLCVGIFPAGPSQTIAQRLGFEFISEMPWINVKPKKANRRLSHLDYTMLEKSYITCNAISIPVQEDEEEEEEEEELESIENK